MPLDKEHIELTVALFICKRVTQIPVLRPLKRRFFVLCLHTAQITVKKIFLFLFAPFNIVAKNYYSV